MAQLKEKVTDKTVGMLSPWANIIGRSTHAPLDGSTVMLSYDDLRQALAGVASVDGYEPDGEGNTFVGQITANISNSSNTQYSPVDDPTGRTGPWYIYSYKGNTGKASSYYATRILTYMEMQAHYVRKYELGSYYTGVGEWYQLARSADSADKALSVAFKDSNVPFTNAQAATMTYGEIFNDYTYNRALSYAHAEGRHTYATGYTAHAEGSQTLASGNYSHAQGGLTVASGTYSHSEGYKTNA